MDIKYGCYRADEWAERLARKHGITVTTPRKGVTKFTDGRKFWEFAPRSDEWTERWVDKKLAEEFPRGTIGEKK